jgi:hypothetical protein
MEYMFSESKLKEDEQFLSIVLEETKVTVS